jgi:hypothetical protein
MIADQAAGDLLAALRDPTTLTRLDAARQTDLVERARAADVLARIAARARRGPAWARLPERLRDILDADARGAAAHRRRTCFEADRLGRALRGTAGMPVLLKGAAYALAGLPAADGRRPGDIDILVPRQALAEVETRLRAEGWDEIRLQPHERRYFRAWMHELPPLRHRERGTVLDVHHAILPPLGRLSPDPDMLIAAAHPLARAPGLRVLAPADMTLHCILHHVQDGEFRHSLRELVDLDDLLRHFGPLPGFWSGLEARIAQFGLHRPARHGLHQAATLLGTPVPAQLSETLARSGGPLALRRTTDAAMASALRASGRAPRGLAERLAARALVLRAHWMKLPPRLLLRHALAKLAARITSGADRPAS